MRNAALVHLIMFKLLLRDPAAVLVIEIVESTVWRVATNPNAAFANPLDDSTISNRCKRCAMGSHQQELRHESIKSQKTHFYVQNDFFERMTQQCRNALRIECG